MKVSLPHSERKQDRNWLLEPEQGSRPTEGGGLLQYRLRLFTPYPQVLEQELYDDHMPQFPFTKDINKDWIVKRDKNHIRI